MPQPLIATEKATAAAGHAIQLAMNVRSPLKSLGDQLIRSASSVPANLSEGHGRIGRDRSHFWRIAYGSAKEVDVHLRLLVAAGAVDATLAQQVIRSFDEVRAMTWRLLHPRGQRQGQRQLQRQQAPRDPVRPPATASATDEADPHPPP